MKGWLSLWSLALPRPCTPPAQPRDGGSQCLTPSVLARTVSCPQKALSKIGECWTLLSFHFCICVNIFLPLALPPSLPPFVPTSFLPSLTHEEAPLVTQQTSPLVVLDMEGDRRTHLEAPSWWFLVVLSGSPAYTLMPLTAEHGPSRGPVTFIWASLWGGRWEVLNGVVEGLGLGGSFLPAFLDLPPSSPSPLEDVRMLPNPRQWLWPWARQVHCGPRVQAKKSLLPLSHLPTPSTCSRAQPWRLPSAAS